ncbi:MAG TPA: hypothetical protein PKH07_14255, partial [bacterium]|nr:hypothetical protein [bacterium]
MLTSSVDLSKTLAFSSVQSGGGQNMGKSPFATDDIIGVGCATLRLADDDTLILERGNSSAEADIAWFVVEFGSDATATPTQTPTWTHTPTNTPTQTPTWTPTATPTFTDTN